MEALTYTMMLMKKILPTGTTAPRIKYLPWQWQSLLLLVLLSCLLMRESHSFSVVTTTKFMRKRRTEDLTTTNRMDRSLSSSCTRLASSLSSSSSSSSLLWHDVVDYSSAHSLWISDEILLEDDSLSSFGSNVPSFLVIVALALFLAAQGWINQQLQGDQGLGAFLKDGAGYKKSAFRPMMAKQDSQRAVRNDPLPWLSLPKLDFVQVAGQEPTKTNTNNNNNNNNNNTDPILLEQMEQLRIEMTQQVKLGNVAEATALKNKLEAIMRDNGFEFQTDNNNNVNDDK
eukprot:scaffold4584_cov98-Amphora_coffeaeformis.AAC.2